MNHIPPSPLYPTLQPYATHQLAVTNQLNLYVEECGNPVGLPVVFLHGGPGAHCKPYHRSLFSPETYRIILFDQRGSGRSTPTKHLQDNTTHHLINDLEQLRKHLGISNWVIFGSSWGATLGLLYAQTHPEHVVGLILRSIFLARNEDIEWVYRAGYLSRLFPKQWDNFTQFLPHEGHWDTPLASYHHYLTTGSPKEAEIAALAWLAWGGCLISFGQLDPPKECSPELLNEARLACHYIFHRCFIDENQLLRDLEKVADVPAILLHGQRDLLCPLQGAYLLEQQWPAAQLRILPHDNHIMNEPTMLSAVVEATCDMAEMLA